MIDHVEIKNFKCLRDVSLDLAPLTVLIGPNDSGMSSVLEALGLVSRALRSDDETLDGRTVTRSLCWRCESGCIEIDVKSANPVLHYNIQIEPGYTSIADHFEIGDELLFRKFPAGPNGHSPFWLGKHCPPDIGGGSESNAAAIHSGWREYALRMQSSADAPREQSADAFRVSEPFHLSADRLREQVAPTPCPRLSATGCNLADVLHAILTGPDRDVSRMIVEQLHHEIPALAKVFTPTFDSPQGSRVGIEFILNGDAKKRPRIPSSQVSDGAMLITAFLALAYSDTPEILLIEEPENGLHPSRLKTVINLLRKMTTGEVGNRPRQVILTTHSPLLLNYVKPEEVRVFSRNGDEGTQVRSMSEVPGLEDLQKTYSTGEIWNLFGEETMFNEVSS